VRLRPRLLIVAALVSLITMPITAMWFLFLGCLTLGVCGFIGAFATDRASVEAPISGALGLLAGPALYIGFAVIT
jgi:hypothetical protein